jgi:predicted metalloendopeptidase
MKIAALFLCFALSSSASLLAQGKVPEPVELTHIDVTLVDKAANPCDNFYQYACGKLLAAHPIPADQAGWGSGSILRIWNQQVLYSILQADSAPSASRTPNEQKIGDFYATCMTQDESGANNLADIKPLEARIASMRSKADIPAVLAALQTSFGSSWTGNDNQSATPLFGFGPESDYNNVVQVVGGVDQGGLGLPSRDFYLNDSDSMKAIRTAYVRWLASLLRMDGMPAAETSAAADSVLRLETAMAHAQMDNITRRDPNKVNNRYTLVQLKALMPNFNFDVYFSALAAPSTPLYEVSSPEYFRALNTLLAEEGLATWKLYLRAHLLIDSSAYLGNAWRDADFDFEKQISGRQAQTPAWRRCTSSVDDFLGEALGQVYVSKVFPPQSKARVLEMTHNIEAAMGRDIDSVPWMQPKTKQEAHLKLANIIEKIGYPDKWRDYSALTIERDSYPANVERATAFELKRQLALINKPLDKTQWGMTPPTVNAYEDPTTNTINFPAGILAPPFFDATRDDVINYGAEGAVIGHELTHDFDDQGRKFDPLGNLRDWWTPADAAAYESRGACIAREYTGPVPGVAGVTQNGKLTQGEDTADNGGLYLALSALELDLKKQGKTMDDKDASGLTNWQRFFLAFGNDSCTQVRPEAMRTQVLTNPHSVPELRVNNTVGNMPEFAKAFSCKASDPEVHHPACRVW